MRANSNVAVGYFKTEPLNAAKEIFGLHRKTVEGDLVFFHAAIAEHLISVPDMPAAGNGRSSLPRGFSASSMERPR